MFLKLRTQVTDPQLVELLVFWRESSEGEKAYVTAIPFFMAKGKAYVTAIPFFMAN